MRTSFKSVLLYGILFPASYLLTGCPEDEDQDNDGYTEEEGDCNDDDSSINPGASEVCDDIDQNCNGEVDEGVLKTFYQDNDDDGYGTEENTTTACHAPQGFSSNTSDCDDTNWYISPSSLEICDDIDNNCNGTVDSDSHSLFFKDSDADGFGSNTQPLQKDGCSLTGYSLSSGDCVDSNSSIHPGANDVSGGGDDDCGGTVEMDPHVGFSGSSFSTIQEAIASAKNGNVIFVAPGTYNEHDISFLGKNIILRSVKESGYTVVDLEQEGSGFIFENAETSQAILEGFTIANGFSSDRIGGAGVFINNASPTIRRNYFVRNIADRDLENYEYVSGGAIFAYKSNSLFEGNAFSYNNATDDVEWLNYGGAVSVSFGNPTFRFNNFWSNGLFNLAETSYSIGGAVDLCASNATFDSNFFDRNYGFYGNAIIAYGCTNEDGEWVLSNTTVTNAVFRGDYSAYDYELLALAVVAVADGTFDITNSTFDSNHNVLVGSLLFGKDMSANVDNTLFVNNSGTITGVAASASKSITLKNSAFINNSAVTGTVIATDSTQNIVIDNVYATNNSSSGPMFYLSGYESTSITNASAFNNMASVFKATATNYYTESPSLSITNTISAFNDEKVSSDILSYVISSSEDTQPDSPSLNVTFNDFYFSDGTYGSNVELDETNLSVDPLFLTGTDKDGYTYNKPHLSLQSPLIDQGSDAIFDLDGTRSDMGTFGGNYGSGFDMDKDGLADYFWPGAFTDAPDGVDTAPYDCDDWDRFNSTCSK